MTVAAHSASRRTKAAWALAAALGCAGTMAHADLATAEKNACLNCHAMDKKLVGPAFKDIAAKYKTRGDAEAYLTQKITQGSSGVWGAVPMPGMPQVPASEVKTMVGWILKQP